MSILAMVGIGAVVIIALLGVAAVFLMDDEVSQTFQNKITAALHHWSQTDEELATMSRSWLETMYGEVVGILDHADELNEDTYKKAVSLHRRLFNILSNNDEG